MQICFDIQGSNFWRDKFKSSRTYCNCALIGRRSSRFKACYFTFCYHLSMCCCVHCPSVNNNTSFSNVVNKWINETISSI